MVGLSLNAGGQDILFLITEKRKCLCASEMYLMHRHGDIELDSKEMY